MRARVWLRDVYARCLSLLPTWMLDPLRSSYQRAAPDSVARALLGTALRLARYRPIDASVSHFQVPGRPDITLVNADSVIARRVYWLGLSGWEGGESSQWEHYCSRAQRIVEIGANIGLYTVLGARAARHTPYIAVEPHPVSRETLEQNVALNGLTNVTIVPAAVVGKRTSATMRLAVPDADPDGAPAGAYLDPDGERGSRPGSKAHAVPVVEARQVVEGADLIKLDVEGFEYDILSSLADYVQLHRPTLFIEVLPNTLNLRSLLCDWLRDTPYRCHVPLANGRLVPLTMSELPQVDLERTYGTRDLILTAEHGTAAEVTST